MKKYIIPFTFALSALMYSCSEDTLDPTLAQNKDAASSITSVEDLSGIANGMYDRMSKTEYYGRDFILYGEVRSDNCYANGKSGRILTPASMAMGTTDAHANDTWGRIYQVIANANLIISKKDVALKGNEANKNQIVGQAYAIRALAHFDLLKLYGQQHVTGNTTVGIPYIKEFKGTNLFPARNTVSEVKGFIYDDLNAALGLMTVALNDESCQHITTYAVNAIKARVAIYFGDWAIAKAACEVIINANVYRIVPEADFVSSWTIDTPVNSIFELAFNSVDNMNIDGLSNIYRGASYGDIRVLSNLRTIFDAGDVRNSSDMIDMDPDAPTYLTNMGKYPATDYSSEVYVLRYEEVVLNYAEALFELNNADPNALTQLNSIPAERGANLYTSISKDNILLERRKELCFEGFRFDDLARTHKDMPYSGLPAADRLKVRYGTVLYGAFNYAFPIPRNETNTNANCPQNLGYN